MPFLAGLAGWGSGTVGTAAEPPVVAVYFFVIDHSGSMSTPTRSGKTRWGEMQDAAVGFLRTVPLESRVWLTWFSSSPSKAVTFDIQSPEDRDRPIAHILNLPSPTGETALYDAMGNALEAAEAFARDNPNRFLSLMVCRGGVVPPRGAAWTTPVGR